MSEPLKDTIDRLLQEAFARQVDCPTCGGFLGVCHHEDHEGAWCGLCGYHRPQLRRDDGNDGATAGRTEPMEIRGIFG